VPAAGAGPAVSHGVLVLQLAPDELLPAVRRLRTSSTSTSSST
jgi:hypothetical protein